MSNKKIFMIAGPNGAGKTTTALSLIPSSNPTCPLNFAKALLELLR